jgi:hypothetical protein
MLPPTMLSFGLTSICNEVNGVRSEATKRFIWGSVTSLKDPLIQFWNLALLSIDY